MSFNMHLLPAAYSWSLMGFMLIITQTQSCIWANKMQQYEDRSIKHKIQPKKWNWETKTKGMVEQDTNWLIFSVAQKYKLLSIYKTKIQKIQMGVYLLEMKLYI